MNKKLISSLLTVAMAINIFAIMPLNAFAIGSKSEVYEKDGYTVTYRIGSEWDNNRSVEVTIENTGDEAILNWALKYDTGGEVYNLWNSKIYDSTEDYTIIKNNGYNYEIEPGRSANYGYIVKGAETLIPENIELFCRRIDVKSGYDVDFNVTSDWYTGFQAEIAITNISAEPIEAWTLGFDSNFDINNIWNAKLLSSEEQSYVTANQLWTTPINPGASASFGFTADKSATENAWAENFTLTAVVVGESSLEKEPEIDYELDTDSDGLPDYYEEIIGSDPKTEHSDDDQLPDGYEALYLGTDPSKSDSDDNGISDADEDFDTDGLTNLEEYNLGTDPFLEDSDYDTLSDKDEVNIHGTNPTKGDTDDDLVPDGDEVKLGLDPNSGSTNGTPDSERTFPQIVTAESEVLAAVNDDEKTPFDVSLEITAAGVAESNVYARESGYSNAIENPSIIGIAPEFVYTDGLEVEEVTVKFELDDSIVDNTLGTYVSSSTEFEGIKRLNIFMFFEDVNMLLPVETFHDEATNTVYTTTDRMGTYCLVDMELFFDNLDIAPSDDEIEEDYDIETQEFLDEPVFSSYNISELKINTGYTEYKDNFDVAFVIDEVSYNESQLEAIKKEIQEVSEIIFKYSDNVTISVYGLNGYGQTHSSWYGRIDNAENITALLSKVTNKEITTVDGYVHISECIDYITAAHKSSESLAEREEYCFIFFNPLHTNSKFTQVNDNKDDEEIDSVFQFLGLSSRTDEYGMAILDRINREGTDINFSTITNSFAAVESGKYSKAMSEMTGGKNIDAVSYESVVTECIEHIYGEIPEDVNAYKAIIATGYSTVVLDKPIIPKYAENAELMFPTLDENNNLVESDHVFTEEEIEDCADTDDDGLWDFQEILFELNKVPIITFDDEGNAKLPTVDDVLNGGKALDEIYSKTFLVPTYVESGAKKAEEQYGDCWNDFLQLSILPINSDPTHEDGDYDGVNDNFDPAKLSCEFTGLFSDYSDSDDDYIVKNVPVEFRVNYITFFNDETRYNKDLSTFASLLVHDIYDKRDVCVNGLISKEEKDSPINMVSLFGLEDIENIVLYNPNAVYSEESATSHNYEFYDDDITEIVIGHKTIEYITETRDVIVIVVRGTNGTIEEWSSNFDVGADTDAYYDAMGIPEEDRDKEWKNKENHKGFDVAANRALDKINNYIAYYCKDNVDKSFFVTGHSRGAAIANLVAKDLIDKKSSKDKVFGYTFAAPNNTTSSEHDNEKYDSIFNIINVDDLVPYLPLGESYDNSIEYNNWGFTKYGVIKSFSIKENCERKWENISDISDYNSNGNLSDTLVEFGKIIDTSGELSRNSLYEYTNSDERCISFKVLNYIDNQTTIDEFKKLYSERIVKFCKMEVEDKSPSIFDPTKHKVVIEQSPAFLMMYLSNLSARSERGGGNKLECAPWDVAKKYEAAKWNFIHSGIDSNAHDIGLGGMRDPHLPFSYYVIASEIN